MTGCAQGLNVIPQQRRAVARVRKVAGLTGLFGKRRMHMGLSLGREHFSVTNKTGRLTIHLTDQALAVGCMRLMTGPAKFFLDRLMYHRTTVLLIVVFMATRAHRLARLSEYELLGKAVSLVTRLTVFSFHGIVHYGFLILLSFVLVTLIAVA